MPTAGRICALSKHLNSFRGVWCSAAATGIWWKKSSLPMNPGGDTIVRMACLDDDANGQKLEVFWEREVDARVLGKSTWETVGQRGFDDPQVFSSYLHTLQWNCVTSTDPQLFQAPLRGRHRCEALPARTVAQSPADASGEPVHRR